MVGTWSLGNPTGLAVKNMGPMGMGTITGTGTIFVGLILVRVPLTVRIGTRSTARHAGLVYDITGI